MEYRKEYLRCKRILSIMVISGYMIQYMTRINMSIAVVDMTSNATNKTTPTISWTENQKHNVLGVLFWGFFLGPLPGGRLAEVFGTKITLGTSMLLTGVFTLLTPVASLNYVCLLVVRFSVGLAVGVAWPAVMPMVPKWIAPHDTSKFMSHTLASQLGSALTLAFSGILIDYLTWPSVFYVSGVIALLWTKCWFYLVYDSPQEHPRIRKIQKEVNYRKTTMIKENTPWAKIFTSKPVWAIIFSNTWLMFNVNTAVNYQPLYLDKILNFNIKANGYLSSLPFLATYCMALSTCWLADKWTKSKTFPLFVIRKIFAGLLFWGSTVTLLVQSFWGSNRVVSIACFVFWQGLCGCSSASIMSNILDISPNYSGTIYGIASSLGGLSGYLSTVFFTTIIKNETSFEQWRCVFWALASTNFVSSLVYFYFGSSDLQEWNSRSLQSEEDSEE